MSGKLIQGQHIFTFDEKHLTFPGNCKYLIARDAVNGNFTIIGTFENGFLNAITLSDKEDSITLKKGGNVLLNNGKNFTGFVYLVFIYTFSYSNLKPITL